ncbi:epsin-2 isoform X1 [Spodoptera litura]|uniref:Epsin-2 isoform X1 n=1 Tax=Spodoptera litura TaxID=69820 RepID=A0A9J7IZL4_SPOLT|nr:epsin-2 isoform X1 [Spodoptera litura]XP_022831240.1 epsin-2 isoform X1 [Spodoptera litura]XP_022831241.1 epsin-2 isoform X1 [Spodoptera litura]XP_022831242.1 epsin-2 isoform X1 [Spodoptera litura]XP_022831243.1 epsin-2 isoform X1 [Spodoptera litura]XP_022831244.1 epsin-2 isoform X1 [Spodoptera litura]XP_022831245.1 epsin-2 isoform X1 [Spodoptera litura]
MPRGRDEMQVNVAGLRRNIKNLAHNYSDAQVKVREATSNDPWGPSSTLMAEIADLTYNVMAFTEIMQMIWKRLNDHGKNWRHVYKALVLMEYLIRTGSEKVAMQCKENIFAIHTLKDFQYMEEGKDQGQNVREKAKSLVNLLKDEERLKNERARALKAKQRFAQSASAFGSDGALDTPSSPSYPAFGSEGALGGLDSSPYPTLSGSGAEWSGREAELARPLTAGEEELQLQLALAMSREEAERDERRRRSDDVRLQLAISQSQQDFQTTDGLPPPKKGQSSSQQSHLLDLLDVNLSSPPSTAPPPLVDPWAGEQPRPETSSDAWSAVGSPAKDPWAPAAPADPWAPVAHAKSPVSVLSSPSSSELEQFDALSQRPRNNLNNNTEPDPFDLTALSDSLTPKPSSPAGAAGMKKSPSAFLGENSSLVNLDRLLQPAAADLAPAHNPFADPAPPPARPAAAMFTQPPPARLTMNELKQQQMGLTGLNFGTASPAFGAPAPMPTMAAPLAPSGIAGGMPTGGLAPSLAPAGVAPGADPWAPVPAPRSTSPWSPPHQRHTPNPFLS